MEITKLNGALGAVIEGLHLETIDDAGFKDLANALLEHHVVFLRDQHLSEEGHRALARRFGTPSVFPVSAHLGSTEILGFIEDTAERPPKADGWHTDITWIDAPPQVAILCALDSPPHGGDTMWADLHGAWDRLSPTLQAALEPLQVRHSQGDGFWAAVGQTFSPEQLADLKATFPGAQHPLVRTHPITGRKALFVAGGFMQSIVGMHPDESELLLGWLKARIEDPNLQVRWHWHTGDVAIWDERCTNHRALADHWPQHRLMRRCTVDGEVPV
ncbi:MAG: putative taurine dioxygenase [Actinomycetia bacterium]|nr:putative taurine dioxygenase [Actinomycetes bacterium]